MMVALVVFLLAQLPPSPSGAILGRVVDKDTGQPLARAVILLSRIDDAGDQMTTTTDERGAFRFDGLPPGRYAGLVWAQRHAPESFPRGGSPIAVTGERAAEVTVGLPRNYAIGVHVLDAFGDPLSLVSVSARSIDTGRVTVAHRQRTNDVGRVRLSGLVPGRYVVCADTGTIGTTPLDSDVVRRERLLRTCFPSSDEANAETVVVTRADVDGLEIRMRRGRTFSIAGTVVGASGAAASSAQVMLYRYSETGSSGSGHDTDDGGRFRFTNVPPGSYTIEASLGGTDQDMRRRPDEASFVPIEIIGEDADDLLVRLAKTVDVQGRVALEDPSATPPASQGSGLYIAAIHEGSNLTRGGAVTTTARRDRTFTLAGVHARRRIEVHNVPKGWYVKSIRYADREVIDAPVEFKAGADAPVLEVVLSDRGAVVTGTVATVAPAPPERPMVYLVRTDGGSVELAAQARVTAAGTFVLGPVRGGEYAVVALPASAPPVEEMRRERLMHLAALGERLTLANVDERSVSLRLVQER